MKKQLCALLVLPYLLIALIPQGLMLSITTDGRLTIIVCPDGDLAELPLAQLQLTAASHAAPATSEHGAPARPGVHEHAAHHAPGQPAASAHAAHHMAGGDARPAAPHAQMVAMQVHDAHDAAASHALAQHHYDHSAGEHHSGDHSMTCPFAIASAAVLVSVAIGLSDTPGLNGVAVRTDAPVFYPGWHHPGSYARGPPEIV